MKKYFIFLFISFFAFQALAEVKEDNILELTKGLKGDSISCKVDKSYVCSNKGCVEYSYNISISANLLTKVYKRCDDKGCDEYSFKLIPSGIYTSFNFNDQIVFRILNDKSSFVETTFSGTSSYNKFGSCE